MGTLAISDDLLSRIERIAEIERRPLDRQAEEMLREAIERREAGRNLRGLMDAIAAMSPAGVAQTDSLELLRQDRSR
jgi:hypothetical protein